MIAIIDIIALVFFGLAFAIVFSLKKNKISLVSKIFLGSAVGVYVIVQLSNVLEHAAITNYFDRFEDYFELLFFPLFISFLFDDHNWLEYLKQIRIEKALRKSEERFRDLTENSTDWIWEIDENCIYTYASPKIYDLLGYHPDEIIGKTPFDLMAEFDRKKVNAAFNKILETKTPFSNLENINQHKNGKLITIETSGIPIIDQNGNLKGYRGIDRDVTDRKKMESQLRQSQKLEAIGTLAGGIAHDFNNLLSSILGYTEIIKDETPKDSPIIEDLNKITSAGNNAKNLVKQILDFSRKADVQHIIFQPSSIIKEAINLLRASIPTSIDIEMDIDPKAGLIMADPTQINQIIMNLCTNAFHAMEKTGGKLTVSLKEVELLKKDFPSGTNAKPGLYIDLIVTDTGPGIAKNIKESIFDPYFTTKDFGKGTGMGLAIVHGIVKGYGGFITLDSKKNQGAKFHVFLPVVRKADHEVKEHNNPELPKGSEKILFIDDEKLLVELGRRMLDKMGYDVVTSQSSKDALKIFKKRYHEFDLVITDQTMPDMTGDNLSKELLKIRPDIPIILCTGYSSIITEDEAKKIGIKAFALKPLIHQDLGELVRKVLDES